LKTAVAEGQERACEELPLRDEFDAAVHNFFVKILVDHQIKVLMKNTNDVNLGGYSFKKGKSYLVPNCNNLKYRNGLEPCLKK